MKKILMKKIKYKNFQGFPFPKTKIFIAWGEMPRVLFSEI